jgi:hypothetical protein
MRRKIRTKRENMQTLTLENKFKCFKISALNRTYLKQIEPMPNFKAKNLKRINIKMKYFEN